MTNTFIAIDNCKILEKITTANVGDKLHILLLHDEKFDKIWHKIIEQVPDEKMKKKMREETNVSLGHLLFAQLLTTKSIFLQESEQDTAFVIELDDETMQKISNMFCEESKGIFDLEEAMRDANL